MEKIKQKFNWKIFGLGLIVGGLLTFLYETFKGVDKIDEIIVFANEKKEINAPSEVKDQISEVKKIEEIHTKAAIVEDSVLDTIGVDEIEIEILEISSDDEDIAKDELILKKQFAVYSLNLNENGEKNLIEYVNISFWKSPVNYKGYKRGEKNLIFFGIDTLQDFRLEKSNDSLWLFKQNQVYLLERSSDFRAFQRIDF